MAGERRWEELEVDCLANVLGRVGMESLLLDVPFVCKSWHEATLNPLCWQNLVFPDFTDRPCIFKERFVGECQPDEGRKFSEAAFVKFVISRSKGNVLTLRLPQSIPEDVVKYAIDECPALTALGLPYMLDESSTNKTLPVQWISLKQFLSAGCGSLEVFLEQISIRFKKLSHLTVYNAEIDEDTANAIVNFMPKLKQLILKKAYIDRRALMTLLRGCNELEQLDVSYCMGFDEDDEEITKVASNISNFCCQGSALSGGLAFVPDDISEVLKHFSGSK